MTRVWVEKTQQLKNKRNLSERVLFGFREDNWGCAGKNLVYGPERHGVRGIKIQAKKGLRICHAFFHRMMKESSWNFPHGPGFFREQAAVGPAGDFWQAADPLWAADRAQRKRKGWGGTGFTRPAKR